MSNPSDPTTPSTPDQPPPAKSDEAKAREKIEEAAPQAPSSFDFQLPDGVKTYSDIPSVPRPDQLDSTREHKAALPPRPASARPASGTFDFIELPEVDPAAPVPPVAEPPLLTPTDDAILLPPPATGDSSISFTPSVPTADPSSFTLGNAAIDLASLPEVPTADPPSSKTSVPDIATLFPGPGSDVFGAAATPRSFAGSPAVPELELPLAEPDSDILAEEVTELPLAEPDSGILAEEVSELPPTAPDNTMVDVSIPSAPTAPPAKSAGAKAREKTAEPPARGPASFEFRFPEGVTFRDLAPVSQPDRADLPDEPTAALPPRPASTRPATGSFDFIELPEVDFATPGSGPGPAPAAPPRPGSPLLTPTHDASPPPATGTPAAGDSSISFTSPPTTDPSSFTLGDAVIDVASLPEVPAAAPGPFEELELPMAEPASAVLAGAVPDVPTAEPGSVVMAEPLTPGHDPEAVLGNVEPVEPISPASGWLDFDALSIPPAEPITPLSTADAVYDLLDPLPAGGPESSDIFSGGRAVPGSASEQSDVIAATSSGITPTGGAVPVPAARAPEAPPGGDAAGPDDGIDLLFLGELDGSSATLGAAGGDDESIHDMPDPIATDPLFDSAQLAGAPELPPALPLDDSADSAEFGTLPVLSGDASSILAGLDEPHVSAGPDSSSVQVEAPGVGRTLTDGRPGDGFDLTVPEEPIPANLFADPSGATEPDSADWRSQSGSDLFAEGPTTPEIDLDGPRGGPIDVDLTAEQPSLAASPSSIFSRDTPTVGAGSGNDPSGPASGETEVEFADADFTPAPGAEPPAPPRKPGLGSSSFELPAPAPDDADEGGGIDWDAVPLADDENATHGIPKDSSLSGILNALQDDSAENPTKDTNPVRADAADGADAPVVTVDWMSGSDEGSAIKEAPLPGGTKTPSKRAEKEKGKKSRGADSDRARKDKPAGSPRAPSDTGSGSTERTELEKAAEKDKRKPSKKGGGVLVGLVLGALFAGGAWAALYFGNAIPNAEKTAQVPPPPGGPPVPPLPEQGRPPRQTPPEGQIPPGPAGMAALDPRAAFAAGNTAKALELLNAKAPANTAEKAVAGHVRVYAKVQGTATDDDLKKGRAELEEVLADADAAKQPDGLKRAVQAQVDLGVSYEAAGDTAKAREVFTAGKTKFPKAYEGVFDAQLDRLDTPPAPGASFRLTPAEIEFGLLAVGTLLADETPKVEDAPEPGTYYWKAVKRGAEGKYTEAIELIHQAKDAHLKRAKALAGRGLNPLTDPLEQMFPRACDELEAYWKLRSELYGNPGIADAIKKDGVAKTLDALAKAQTDLTTAKADLKTAAEKVVILEKNVEKLDKDYKGAEKARTEAEDKLKTTSSDLRAAEKLVKDKTDLLAAVVAELKPAVALPEKWRDADLIAGVKSAAARATGPDLKDLVPDAMVGIGGGGLAAGQLLDIAKRLNKAEAAAKAADEKLAAETKKLTDKYDADTAKLKTDHAAAVKALTDGYAADTKKLKDASAEDIKKLTDKFAADAKKVTEDHLAAVKKLDDDHAAALKAEQAKTEAEKQSAALKEIGFQKQLANVISPAQALDIWIPVLTDLRRPADADPALALAKRALAASLPDSEDAAKAHTLSGMARLLKGDTDGAKEEFRTARRNPTYKEDKSWAKVADAGLDAVEDPLAPYRQPVVLPPVDRKAAAKALDAGIGAYKAGRYDDAAAALTDATKNDPTDPVAWYYLGAVRWAQGNEERAKKDFGQGAEREKASPTPARVVSAALAPIQGAPRDALDRARP